MIGDTALPHDNDLEQHILGALLIDNKTYWEVEIPPAYFYHSTHRKIYEAISALILDNEVADVITVADKCRDVSLSKLTGIIAATITAANIKFHMRRLKQLYEKRLLLNQCVKTIQGIQADTDPGDLLAEFYRLSEETIGTQKKNIPLSTILSDVITGIEINRKHGHKVTGVTTGYPRLDSITSGWQPGDLIILAGRPSMGKTAFAIAFALHACAGKHKAMLVSLEMTGRQLGERILSMQSEIAHWKIRKARITDDELQHIYRSSEEIYTYPLTVLEDAYSDEMIYRSIYREVRQNGVGLVIVDYLQLIDSTRNRSKEQQVDEICKQLKRQAKALNIPIILVAQLNRNVEQREDKRPILADLRDSGGIEQHADIVAFLYREGYYKPSVDPEKLELILKKGRNIGTGTFDFRFAMDVQAITERNDDIRGGGKNSC